MERRLDYWEKTGLLRSSIKQAHGKGSRRVYSFEDLVEVRVIAGLLAIGVSLPARTPYPIVHMHNPASVEASLIDELEPEPHAIRERPLAAADDDGRR